MSRPRLYLQERCRDGTTRRGLTVRRRFCGESFSFWVSFLTLFTTPHFVEVGRVSCVYRVKVS